MEFKIVYKDMSKEWVCNPAYHPRPETTGYVVTEIQLFTQIYVLNILIVVN